MDLNMTQITVTGAESLVHSSPAAKLKPLKIFDFKLMTLSLTFQGLLVREGQEDKRGRMSRDKSPLAFILKLFLDQINTF